MFPWSLLGTQTFSLPQMPFLQKIIPRIKWSIIFFSNMWRLLKKITHLLDMAIPLEVHLNFSGDINYFKRRKPLQQCSTSISNRFNNWNRHFMQQDRLVNLRLMQQRSIKTMRMMRMEKIMISPWCPILSFFDSLLQKTSIILTTTKVMGPNQDI